MRLTNVNKIELVELPKVFYAIIMEGIKNVGINTRVEKRRRRLEYAEYTHVRRVA